MRSPVRMRIAATHSLPAKPTSAAAMTHQTLSSGCAWSSFCHRLPGGDDRAGEDNQHDEHAGHVFRPVVAVGEAAVRRAPAEGEGYPERQGGQRVGGVVDGVGQQPGAAADDSDDQLEDRRRAQDQQAGADGADAFFAALQRGIDLHAAMGVPMPQPEQPQHHRQRAAVVVIVIMVMLVAGGVIVIMVMLVVVGVIVIMVMLVAGGVGMPGVVLLIVVRTVGMAVRQIVLGMILVDMNMIRQ